MTLKESEILLASSAKSTKPLMASASSPDVRGSKNNEESTESPPPFSPDVFNGMIENDLGSLVAQILASARGQGRLILGLEACSRALETKSPNGILVCIIPRKIPESTDSMFQICLTLMEAHCFETGVLQVRVDNTENLLEIVYGSDFQCEKFSHSCLLVQRGSGKVAFAEEKAVNLLEAHAHQGRILPLGFPSQ